VVDYYRLKAKELGPVIIEGLEGVYNIEKASAEGGSTIVATIGASGFGAGVAIGAVYGGTWGFFIGSITGVLSDS
jgi:hypothetical protein